MKIWLDAQLSPAIGKWMEEAFDITEAFAVQADSALRATEDLEIFKKAREAKAVVMTKDRDFVDLVERLGPPPQIIWLTCGNTSNQSMRRILTVAFSGAMELLRQGEQLVEISDLE